MKESKVHRSPSKSTASTSSRAVTKTPPTWSLATSAHCRERRSRAVAAQLMSSSKTLTNRVERVEERLGPRRRLAVAEAFEAVDPRGPGCAVDPADAVDRAEDEAPVANRELVAVERPRGRPGRAIALGVELAAVTGAAEASRGQSRYDLDLADVRPPELLLLDEDRSVRLRRTADVRAAARHDREARRLADEAVVPDEGRPARDLAGLRVGQERGDHELAFRKCADRPEVDRPRLGVAERRQDRRADRGQRHTGGDQATEA